VYSLLISGIIAIGGSNLSRFHSGMTIILVMSPLSSTLVVYSILGFCGRAHRLDSILSRRREHLLPRLLVIAFAVIAVSLIFFGAIANDSHFTASPCEPESAFKSSAGIISNLMFIPYAGVIEVLLIAASITSAAQGDRAIEGIFAAIILGVLTPVIILLGSVIYGAIKKRRVLAKAFKAQSNRWKIWVAWDTLDKEYPCLHFCGVFFVPMIYWILVNELNTFTTPDNLFVSSFGQVLAVFVILPPLLQVVQMSPTAVPWFMNLTFVRFVTGRPQAVPVVRGLSLEDGIEEKDGNPFRDPVPAVYHVPQMPAADQTPGRF